MTAQAVIQINAVTGSNPDLPIDVLVQLDNVNGGGEVTFNWQILDQPPGPVDALSSAVIQNPTFTPKKEGSYLVELIVNLGLVSEVRNRVIAAVRQLKTRTRVPAAGEQLEVDPSDGWAPDADELLRLVDSLRGDPNVLVGEMLPAGTVRGEVLRMVGLTTIKTGLPGEELVPIFDYAETDSPFGGALRDPLYLLERGVNGSVTPAVGDLVLVRRAGLARRIPTANLAILGFPGAGDPLYARVQVVPKSRLSDVRATTLPGRFARVLGTLLDIGGGFVSVNFDGSLYITQAGTLAFGNQDAPSVAGTTYLDPFFGARTAQATEPFFRAPEDGVIDRLYVRASTGPVGDSHVLTVRIGGANQPLTATLAAAATIAQDVNLAHALLINAGDELSVECVTGGAIVTGAVNLTAALRYRTLTTS